MDAFSIRKCIKGAIVGMVTAGGTDLIPSFLGSEHIFHGQLSSQCEAIKLQVQKKTCSALAHGARSAVNTALLVLLAAARVRAAPTTAWPTTSTTPCPKADSGLDGESHVAFGDNVRAVGIPIFYVCIAVVVLSVCCGVGCCVWTVRFCNIFSKCGR